MSKRPRGHSTSSSPSKESISSSPTEGSTADISTERTKHVVTNTKDLPEVMHCSLPPHRETLSFTSYENYEVHYLQNHVNRCSECSKNFPGSHLLNIHIEENHDPLIAARRARGEKTFGCFIEDCERKCSTPQKRRMHLIDKHMFPRNYNFFIVNDGIDKQTSMLRPMNSHRRRVSMSSALEGRLRRRSSASQSNPPTAVLTEEKTSGEMDIDELEKSMSALKFVPTSVVRNRGNVSSR
ncbi:Zinc finger C2H2 [Penicillium brevicompactum]|uniref:Zinc finger C2H2 n=1 Tax=Penicillium brevicompactum TaxID=5074 RepID=A0A9W9UKL5_PENBR|nr:Zinc finger C2H2 [Penicillium brevicompactum]KAJ5343135.1 Zinc finger C2H2 [Penicillium brevicompactum]KAJ5345323.1 Zinc finger C2H2 [Penicillium brevicompactum]